MKKLLIATGVLSALVMTGCATNTANTTDTTNAEAPAHPHGHHHGHHHGHKHGKPMKHKEGETFNATYACDKNAKVEATYNPDSENGTFKITAPSLSLSGADVTMTLAPSGSGMRFVNESTPNATYDWHTKGTLGILDVTTNGKTHTFKCEGSFPMHEHGQRAE